MTAAMKSAKKKASKAADKAAKPRVRKMTIRADKTFKSPIKLKPGELLKIVGPGTKDVDITVSIDLGEGGGGGGPIVIHS